MLFYGDYKLKTVAAQSRELVCNRMRCRSIQAFTLVELMVAISIISLIAGSSIYAILDSNRFAAVDRMRTAAKTACQEKIDQALTTPYSPPDLLPAIFTVSGSIPAPSGTPDHGTLTATETSIPLYVDQTDATQSVVHGTRKVWVSLSDSTLGLVRVWVRVDYTFQGKAYAYEMYVLRAPD